MHYEIFDNFLSEEDFSHIKNHILYPQFSWDLTTSVSERGEKLPIICSYYFTHIFWANFNVQPDSQIFSSVLNKLNCRAIIRIKANLYPSTNIIMQHDNHIDYDFTHRGAILYINTNNGLTILEDKIEIKSVENRLLLFDPTKPHRSTTCTDDKCRINVNFNFF